MLLELAEAVEELLMFDLARSQGSTEVIDDFGGGFAYERFVGEAVLLGGRRHFIALQTFSIAL